MVNKNIKINKIVFPKSVVTYWINNAFKLNFVYISRWYTSIFSYVRARTPKSACTCLSVNAYRVNFCFWKHVTRSWLHCITNVTCTLTQYDLWYRYIFELFSLHVHILSIHNEIKSTEYVAYRVISLSNRFTKILLWPKNHWLNNYF